ncbi:magnesium transporter MgtE N-terminal domain-containing protein [Agrococcus casei]|uniref:Mg/Co/Ni transporter MgtE / CBS domain n=1 Tax=Agrococcus casei LMG 22410 TaxID=1255656 RepID=A0A1R4FXF2_9MICO|nr:CBS domain-containing protein [Agrococcus casei]SJM60531.1 Mg/Co/Ni transporter MgtE / CBS domain [Agrococcus casei LMG 22410]
MSVAKAFVARLAGVPVFNPDGDKAGRVRDVVIVNRASATPRVIGMVVELGGKRRAFMSIGRVLSIGGGQVISTGRFSPKQFKQRGGEQLVLSEVLGRSVTLLDGSKATIEDLSIEHLANGEWQVDEVFLRRPRVGPFSKGKTLLVGWAETQRDAEAENDSGHLLATFEDMPAADVANELLDLPTTRRLEVVDDFTDGRLADVLEEMKLDSQVDILDSLDDDRAAEVLDHMQPDDAADLIAQLSDERMETLLGLMEHDEAEDVRMLLSFAHDSAGGLMTSDPIILASDATVAEALAMVRNHEVAPALAAAVCVTLPPYETPTGKFLGTVHFQRLLRYPPGERLGTLLDDNLDPVHASTSDAEVTRLMATYNLVQLPVVDDAGHLLGVVTIDDVLDHILPDDWRDQDDRQEVNDG